MADHGLHEDGRVRGGEAQAGAHLAHDDDADLGVVAAPALADVVEQGADQEQVRPAHVADDAAALAAVSSRCRSTVKR